MKNYLAAAVVGVLIVIIVFCFNREAQADSVNVNYTVTDYDYTFPANVFLDESSNGYGISYSFDLSPLWSLDVGYSDLGKAEQTVLFIPTEFETELFTIAAHGALQIATIATHAIKVHGILGVARANTDVTVGANSLSDSDMGVYYGAGFSLMISPVHEITAMYKKVDLTFDNTVVFDYNPSMIEVGYSFNF